MTSRIVAAEGLEAGVPQSVADALRRGLDALLEKEKVLRCSVPFGRTELFDDLYAIVPIGQAPGGVPKRIALVERGFFGSTNPYLGARVIITHAT